jgi:hypothetical protein
MSLGDDQPPLNPAQQEVLALLRVPFDERPQFDAELRHHLRATLDQAFKPLVDALPSNETLFISKHRLAQVHGCETRYLVEEEAEFEWTVPIARGTVVHKAVELSVHWKGEAVPLTLVDEAMARIENDNKGVSAFLQGCDEADLAELRALANDSVAKFLESFPPLKRGWRPVTEARVRIDFHDEIVTLQGRVDLALGQPQGTTAGKVLIDLKTGGFSPSHRDDLRFYALLETIRLGTPPMLLASYYLDQGRVSPEDVTEGVLEAATARVIAGAERLVALTNDPGEVVKRTGPPCRWCPVSDTCDEGQGWLEGGRDSGDVWDIN